MRTMRPCRLPFERIRRGSSSSRHQGPPEARQSADGSKVVRWALSDDFCACWRSARAFPHARTRRGGGGGPLDASASVKKKPPPAPLGVFGSDIVAVGKASVAVSGVFRIIRFRKGHSGHRGWRSDPSKPQRPSVVSKLAGDRGAARFLVTHVLVTHVHETLGPLSRSVAQEGGGKFGARRVICW
jgi:hypothetical protein